MLLVQETWINRTENHMIDETEPYESMYSETEVGALYKALQREYGRCIGKVRIDTKEHEAMAIGWVFVQRAQYTDCKETYLRETWVTLHDALPERHVTHKYHPITD